MEEFLVYAVKCKISRWWWEGEENASHHVCKPNRSATCNWRQSTSSRIFCRSFRDERKRKKIKRNQLDIPVHFWCVSAPTQPSQTAQAVLCSRSLVVVCCCDISEILSACTVYKTRNFQFSISAIMTDPNLFVLLTLCFFFFKLAINRWHWKCQLCQIQ